MPRSPGERLAQVCPCLRIPIVKHVVVHTFCVCVRPWSYQADKADEDPELTCSHCLSPENKGLCSSEGTSGQPFTCGRRNGTGLWDGKYQRQPGLTLCGHERH